jgi:hypothetical protein
MVMIPRLDLARSVPQNHAVYLVQCAVAGEKQPSPSSTLNAKLATSLGISNKARQAIEASGMDDQAVTAMVSTLTKKQLENLSTE